MLKVIKSIFPITDLHEKNGTEVHVKCMKEMQPTKSRLYSRKSLQEKPNFFSKYIARKRRKVKRRTSGLKET